MIIDKDIIKHIVFFQQLQNGTRTRRTDPTDISIPPGYQIEAYAEGLDTPISLAFTEEGNLLVADSGESTGIAKVLIRENGNFRIIAQGFRIPISGITYKNGEIYVSHRGIISILKMDGTRNDIISGLPSYGDFINNRVEFGNDGKIYFGQGSATNSGVVGLNNDWILDYSFFRDEVGSNIILKGSNFETANILIPADESAFTGSFAPFGEPYNKAFQLKEGSVRATGSILRANLDGSNLELVAWGVRNPVCIKLDRSGRLYFTNQGMDSRGSRPIHNAPDEFQVLTPGAWYGWPDYSVGVPITSERFASIDRKKQELLFETIPSVPRKPIAEFPSGSNLMGFDINYHMGFGPVGEMYIANFGRVLYDASKEYSRSGVGHRITRVNPSTGEIGTFAMNKSGFPGEGGFGRPTDIVFGPDNAMYIADYSLGDYEVPKKYHAGTGVIWRVVRLE